MSAKPKRDGIDIEARALMLLAHAVEGLDKQAIERLSNYLHDRYVRDEMCMGLSMTMLKELNEARAKIKRLEGKR
jgi:hypothetical protein